MITGIIYKIVCRDVEIKECYVGSTTNFVKRKCGHKSSCNNEKKKDYDYYVYQFIREHGGWDNWDVIQVENFECATRPELRARERYWFETLQATINKQVPNRGIKESQKQYRQDNLEALKIQQNQKHDCLCGGKYTHSNLLRHAKTTKHMLYEALHQDDPEE